MTGLPHELHLARFTANPDDRVAFEFLEEHLFMQGDWAGLADLYRRRCAAPSLQSQARQRAELFMRLAQVCEDRLEDVDAAIAAYSEAVALEPRLRRALRQLRSLFQARGSWEAVLQISEQEAMLAASRDERARAYVEMADVWRRHLGDPEQAEQLYARARLEGWKDGRAPARAEPSELAGDEFSFYDNLEVDLEVEAADDGAELETDPAPETTQATLTMPDLAEAPSAGEQRAARVLGVLERKLAARESRGAGLDAESVHLRLRIAELCAGVQGDPVAAIAVLEPALANPSALVEVAPTLAGLYQQLGHPQRAVAAYQRLLTDLPDDAGARAALGDLYRSRGEAAPLAQLLREELPRADRDRELEIQLELASLAAESLGDPAGAVPHLRRCLEIEPARADLLEWALSACALRGGPLAQLDLVEHVCERAGNDVERAALLARRGTLLADALSWHDEAGASWRAALAIDPNQALARERLASL